MTSNHTFAILSHKESLHLQECIDSLKYQAGQSRVILCTSTPSIFLKDIANKNNLELFVNPKRNGIAGDWNFALNTAMTKYVTLAHQDDVYSKEYASEIIASGESRKDTLIIFSNYDEIVSNKNQTFIRKNSLNFFIKKILLYFNFKNKNYTFKNKEGLLIFGNPIGCPTVTFHKENIKDFRFDNDLGINMDWKAWYDLAQKNGSFIWVKKTLVSHRIYAESETSRGLAENRRQDEDLKIFKLFWSKTFATLLSKIYSLSYKNNKNH